MANGVVDACSINAANTKRTQEAHVTRSIAKTDLMLYHTPSLAFKHPSSRLKFYQDTFLLASHFYLSPDLQ